MKQLFIIILLSAYTIGNSQTYNASYVHSLYEKYPTTKSDLCPACKEWHNPFYESIADTERHMPIVTHLVYTKEHRLMQEAIEKNKTFGRSGIFAAWSPVKGQPKLDNVYKAANKIIGKDNTIFEIVYGHCQAWILLAWCQDAAIFSDTQDFNEGMEYQGQNIGTEIATENLCRTLTGLKQPEVTDSINIWCGTYGSQKNYSSGNITVNVPTHYWKIIQYFDKVKKTTTTTCWWMPNLPTESENKLAQREISINDLLGIIGFNPMTVFVKS